MKLRIGHQAPTKDMSVQVRYKGSSKSGNYGHAGRPGKIGGSTARSFAYPTRNYDSDKPAEQIEIAGLSGKQWMEKSARLSAVKRGELEANLRGVQDLDPTATKKYMDRLDSHRAMVMEETLKVSQHYSLTKEEQAELMFDVVHHDTYDKYNKDTAIPYINKIAMGGQKGGAGETKEFWKACNAHHDDNPHHPEYWEQGNRAIQMPTVHLIQMTGDWIATARYFNTSKDAYYRANGGTEFLLHPNTRAAAERELGIKETPFPHLFPRDFFPKSEQPAALDKEYKAGKLPSMGIDAVLLDEPGKKEVLVKFRYTGAPK